MILCIFFCCASKPRPGKWIFCTFFALFSFSAIPTSPPHGGKSFEDLSSNWFGRFSRRTRCQIGKGLTARVRLPAITIDRRAIGRLKGEKLQALRLRQEENLWTRSYKLCSKCKPTWQRQANEFLRWNLSSNNIREFSRHHSPTRDDQISVDEELLDYSDDDVSLATGPQEQAIKPNYKAIKPS